MELHSFGLTLSDINIQSLMRTDIRDLKKALYEFKVLIIKRQKISIGEYVDFTKLWGEIVVFIDSYFHHPDYPEILVSSNAQENNRMKGINRVNYWHSDSSFMKNPLPITMLYGEAVPEVGGGTDFIDMSKVLWSLDKETRQKIRSLCAIHEGAGRLILTEEHLGLTVDEVIEQDKKLAPPSTHPMLIKHPISGEEVLYVSEGYTKKIVDIAEEESSQLLKKLFYLTQHSNARLRHVWEPGDILIWDNRSVVHRAAPEKTIGARTLYRIGVHDQEPFYVK